jgi:hypothetical protein
MSDSKIDLVKRFVDVTSRQDLSDKEKLTAIEKILNSELQSYLIKQRGLRVEEDNTER